jgi:uncharacterized membrane protein
MSIKKVVIFMSNVTVAKPRLSVKVQTLATIIAIAGAVLVPQIFHILGAISGLGTALGETFLPMHLPVILVGLLAGPYAGAVSGLLGPLFSFVLTAMPGKVMLPFMMIELCVYGLTAGLLRNVKLPTLLKVLIAQVAGRAIRAIAILLSVYAFGNTNIHVPIIWNSIKTGAFGLVLQWLLLPLIVFWVENKSKNED